MPEAGIGEVAVPISSVSEATVVHPAGASEKAIAKVKIDLKASRLKPTASNEQLLTLNNNKKSSVGSTNQSAQNQNQNEIQTNQNEGNRALTPRDLSVPKDLTQVCFCFLMLFSKNRSIVKRKFRIVRIGQFSYSSVLRRGKYARSLWLSLKTYEMKIQSVS